MKILVVGASGATGRLVSAELTTRGHEVTVFVRRPEVGAELGDRVRVAVGDVLEPADVDRAMEGQEAVVVTLGIRENPLLVRLRGSAGTALDLRSAGTRNVIEAMRRHGVERLVVQTTHGVGTTRADLSLTWKLLFRLLLQPQIEDTERQEELVRESGLSWVLVRPVSLTDGPRQPVLVSPAGRTRSMNVSRASVAEVLAEATQQPESVGQALSVSA